MDENLTIRTSPFKTHHYELTKDMVFSAVYMGIPIDTTEDQYPQVRVWLTQCAEFWNSEGQGIREFVARNEIKRLDQLFEVTEREA